MRVLELRPVAHVRALLRSWQGRVILGVLVVQLVLPLRYYLPTNRDQHDERFAWRMFSPMRMVRCEPHFARNDKPIELDTEFQRGWTELAIRGRFNVVEAMGAHLCAKYPGTKIKVSLDCTYLDKHVESYGGYDMCYVPLL